MTRTKVQNSAACFRYVNTERGRLKHLFHAAKGIAKECNREFELTFDEMMEVWNLQEGRCFYSKRKLTPTSKDFDLMSLTRLNPSKPYHKDNVAFVCWGVNKLKNSLSHDAFLDVWKTLAPEANMANGI